MTLAGCSPPLSSVSEVFDAEAPSDQDAQHLEMVYTFRSEDPDLNTMTSVSSCVGVNPGGV